MKLTNIQLFLHILLVIGLVVASNVSRALYPSTDVEWIDSNNLKGWYHPWELCLMRTTHEQAVERPKKELMRYCVDQTKRDGTRDFGREGSLICRAGGVFHGLPCYGTAPGVPSFVEREHLLRALHGYDDPRPTHMAPLYDAMVHLARHNYSLLMVGDSMLFQLNHAMLCEMQRLKRGGKEALSPRAMELPQRMEVLVPPSADHNAYTHASGDGPNKSASARSRSRPRTGTVTHNSYSATVDRRAPTGTGEARIVHTRLERRPLLVAPLANEGTVEDIFRTAVQRNVERMLAVSDGVVVLMNGGVHCNSEEEMSTYAPPFLRLVDDYAAAHPNVVMLLSEVAAQHFPSNDNGYFAGRLHVNHSMAKLCAPVRDASPASDWRNRIIYSAVNDPQRPLTHIHLLPLRNMTLPLWKLHFMDGPSGLDCTHFCWTPMMYQHFFDFFRHWAMRLVGPWAKGQTLSRDATT